MRISKLSLTNFRSFKTTQTIEFAPLTLLFGPNNVGKSTVLMALFYLQQILAKQQANPSQIEALASKSLGGFRSLVHGKDLAKEIVIKVEMDKGDSIGKTYLGEATALTETILDDANVYLDEQAFLMPSVAENCQQVALEFTIAWSKTLNSAKVKSLRVWADDHFLGELFSDLNQTTATITKLNFAHAALRPANQAEWLSTVENTAMPIAPQALEAPFEAQNFTLADNGCCSLFQYYIEDKTTAALRTPTFDTLTDNQQQDDDPLDQFAILPIAIECNTVGLPRTNENMVIAGIDKPAAGINADYLNFAQMQSLFSEVFVAPLDNLLNILAASANIGPLRTVPDHYFSTVAGTSQADWYNGDAAWDLLAQEDSGLNDKVSDWLKRMGTGCRILHPGDQVLGNSVAQKPFLFDEQSQLAVWPSELGVGISQVIPLVVAANSIKKGIVAIEQPELHIHPRIQTQLGDLLTQVKSNANFLVETHSEHLILRILRRIRETNEGKLPSQLSPVATRDISVIYIEPSENGAIVRKYEVTEDGDFYEDWPDGFFDERDEELF